MAKSSRYEDFYRQGGGTRPENRMSKLSKIRLERVTAGLQAARVLSLIAVLASLFIAGCAVGPNFKRPAAPPEVSDYTVHPVTETVTSTNVAGGEAQHFTKGGD